MGGALGRGAAQKVLNKLLDKADDQGKNGNILVHLIKKWAIDTYLIPEISKFTENPYEKYTIDDYAKKYSKKKHLNTNFLEAGSSKSFFGKKSKSTAADSIRAGPKFHRYIAWQIMQESKVMNFILPSSKLDTKNKNKIGKTGNEICLFQPLLIVKNFKIGTLKFKLSNPYMKGKLALYTNFDGFDGDIKYSKAFDSIINFAVDKLQINYAREFTRESIDHPWRIKHASPFRQWLECTVMNMIFPVGGGEKQTWKEWFLSPTCTTSAIEVTGKKLWRLVRL